MAQLLLLLFVVSSADTTGHNPSIIIIIIIIAVIAIIILRPPPQDETAVECRRCDGIRESPPGSRNNRVMLGYCVCVFVVVAHQCGVVGTPGAYRVTP